VAGVSETGGPAGVLSLDAPPARVDALERVLDRLLEASDVAMTTHVNADGDGAGSEVALAAWLGALGRSVHIVNPTPFPESFRFLVSDAATIADAGSAAGDAALQQARLLVVLDTAEPGRIGRVASALRRLPVVLLDHHPPGEGGITGVAAVQDPTAAATGELVYDLLRRAEQRGRPAPWPAGTLEGLYTAIVTDTGSFRFSNTTPRVHAIAGDLLRRGVDPERMFRCIYGTVPLSRVRLLQRSLAELEVDAELPITWITVPAEAIAELHSTSDDLDGIIEHARSIHGTQVALLFRRTTDGSTKVSLRSNGDLDVNAIARRFGGGGHVKAAGALLPEPLDSARDRVLKATREAVRALLHAAQPGPPPARA
jgi:bifunctional oligoribonuclease and PAP phosphatase NrnA